MFSQTFAIQNFLPALAAEQAGKAQEQMAILDGRNFAWKASGPFSAYGSVLLEPPGPDVTLSHMRHSFMKRIANEVYHFASDGVYRLGATWERVFEYGPAGFTSRWDLAVYKWTYAYVGTRHWFCHPEIGLVFYDEFDNVWGTFWLTKTVDGVDGPEVVSCWNGPPYAITQADNRLVLLLEDVVIWSEFDRGDLWSDKWQKGAGAQSLALIRYGQPYTVMPYNDGWLTFTSMGIMLSRTTYDQVLHPDGDKALLGPVVFNHQEVSFTDLAVGPTAITHIDERQVIWLSKTGFHMFAPTTGGGFGAKQFFEVSMSRFWTESILPGAQSILGDKDKYGDLFMLEAVPEMQAVFCSVKADLGQTDYLYAMVYQFDLDRWGSFDAPHNCFGSPVQNGQVFTYRHGYRTWRGVTHQSRVDSWIRFTPVRLQLPQEPAASENLVTSVQSVRIGTGKRSDAAFRPMNNFAPAWSDNRRAAEPASKFNLLLSSGWDAETVNGDQSVYATLVDRSERSAHYVVDTTGLTHVITVQTEYPDDFFHITHVELGFFIAGVR